MKQNQNGISSCFFKPKLKPIFFLLIATLLARVSRVPLAALLGVGEEQELSGELGCGRGALLARVGLVALVVVAHVPEQPLVRPKVHLAHLAVELL